MKPLLAVIVLFCPALSHAGNRVGCGVDGHCAPPPHYNNKVVAVATPYYFAVGNNVQIEAQVVRATQPLLDEIKALREEQAAFRQEAKAGFSSLSAKFSFRGQGTFVVEGDGGSDPVVVPPNPSPDTPEPVTDAAPALTPAVQAMFETRCAACHTNKAKGFNIGQALTANDSSEILARVTDDRPDFRMPPKGSTEADRKAVTDWVFGPELLKLQNQLKSRNNR